MTLTLVALAAGLSTRFGSLKQLVPLGPSGETLLDYALFDAARAGATRAVLVVRREIEARLRARLDSRWHGSLALDYVEQRLDDLPPGFTVPPGRTKPWGTGHAALVGARAAHGPFLLCNADDFYGREAFRAVARALGESEQPVLAAYRLADTLAPTGRGVSRGMLEIADGHLRSVTETYELRPSHDGIVGRTDDGATHVFSGAEPVSTNLWGCTSDVATFFEGAFRTFLAESRDQQGSEFLIGAAVNEYITRGAGRVRVVRVPGPFFGITHLDDAPAARERLAALVAQGLYPNHIPEP